MSRGTEFEERSVNTKISYAGPVVSER